MVQSLMNMMDGAEPTHLNLMVFPECGLMLSCRSIRSFLLISAMCFQRKFSCSLFLFQVRQIMD